MTDVFAELMAYLFAEDRRNHPMSAQHSRQILSAVQGCIHILCHRINQKEEDLPDEGQKRLI